MFTPPPTFGYADPHIRHIHEYNALHFGKPSKTAAKGQSLGPKATEEGPSRRTTDPVTTGTSVLAVKYKDGIMVAGDTLVSYGSMARYFDLDRVLPLGKYTLIGGTGDYSDFQYIMKFLEELITEDQIAEDGSLLFPHSIHSYLTRVMYQRRNKFDPLYNRIVVGGFRDGTSYLGMSDLRGLSYEGDFIATGYGDYIAKPLLRKHWRPDLTYEQAKHLLESCLRVLYYRDARAHNQITLGVVTQDGPKVSEPYVLDTDWSSGNILYSGFKIKNAGVPAESKPISVSTS